MYFQGHYMFKEIRSKKDLVIQSIEDRTLTTSQNWPYQQQ